MISLRAPFCFTLTYEGEGFPTTWHMDAGGDVEFEVTVEYVW